MPVKMRPFACPLAIAVVAACSPFAAPGGGAPQGGAGLAEQHASSGASGGERDFQEHAGDRVFFDKASATIGPEGQKTLARQAQWLMRRSHVKVIVEGHCDERGTREYDLALGYRRARTAKEFLIALGVDAGRIGTISYGKERPAVVGSDEAAWAQDRSAVTVILQ